MNLSRGRVRGALLGVFELEKRSDGVLDAAFNLSLLRAADSVEVVGLVSELQGVVGLAREKLARWDSLCKLISEFMTFVDD